MRLLWLDDYRDPFINSEGKVPMLKGITEIIWVKNYNEFVDWISKNGLPEVISYDHDLADEHYTPEEYWSDYAASKVYQDSKIYQEKTGLDCAKFVIDYCIDNTVAKDNLPISFVHSANPVGADNIKHVLNNFVKYYYAHYDNDLKEKNL